MLARLASWRTLKSGVLLFWAAWFTLVVLTNVFDALRAGRVLPAGWTFASGNWELMLKATAVHGTPVAVVAFLFLGVIAWEALAGVLFWRAWVAGGRGGLAAFTVGLALWAAFVLADEIFIAYSLEAVHLRLVGLQLLSVLALRLLPDDPP
jgi:hypothetical protein